MQEKTWLTSNAKTDLDQVVAGLPWADAFREGAGVDVITGGVAGSALEPFQVKENKNKSSHTRYRFIQDESDFDQEVEVSASGKYNIEGVNVTAAASYLRRVKFSETSITMLAQYESRYEDYDLADDYQLTSEARNLVADPPRFRDTYGDYFIAGARRGSRFTAIYVCQARTAESMDQFKASFGADAPEVFTAEGSVRFMQAASSHSINVSFDLYMDGHEGGGPKGPWNPEKIIEALNWFQENEKGIKLQTYLRHYSTLDPNYPRSIEVDPAVFVELSQLYRTVWALRDRYGSLPGYYQQQYRERFDELIAGVEANRSVLVEDRQKLDEYRTRADSLLVELDKVFARQDFYLKVQQQISIEPGQNSEIKEGKGQQSWLYGFSTYTKSNAVVINSLEDRYHEDWHIGWREHTFEFRNDNVLIVGWEVVSNWNDGSNGSWWKAAPRNLLEHYGAVHVKSQYDRGCDWSCRWYFVDARDYQFE